MNPEDTTQRIAALPTKAHPEQQQDEIYLGNTRPEDLRKSSWRSSRLGKNPLRRDGTPYTGGGLKPWFIKRSEVEAAIEAKRIENKPWSADSIRVFEEMLAEGQEQLGQK